MTPDEFYSDLEREAAAFSGTLGVCAQRLSDGLELAWNADEVFPAASVIKLPILLVALARVEAGELELSRRVPVGAEDRVTGSGVLHALEPGLTPTLRDLLALMVVVSDNTATNLVLDLVGGRDAVNATLRGWNLPRTTSIGKLQLPPHLKNEDQKAGRLSETTPREAARLLTGLWRGEWLGPAGRELALEILKGQQFLETIPRLLPEGAWTATKSGSIEGVRHDVGLVGWGETVYAMALMSKGCADVRYHPDNEATLALARVSRLVFEAMTT